MTGIEELFEIVAHLNVAASEVSEDVRFSVVGDFDSQAIIGPEISGYDENVDGYRHSLPQVKRRVQIQGLQIAAAMMDLGDDLRTDIELRVRVLEAEAEAERNAE